MRYLSNIPGIHIEFVERALSTIPEKTLEVLNHPIPAEHGGPQYNYAMALQSDMRALVVHDMGDDVDLSDFWKAYDEEVKLGNAMIF